MAFIPLPHGAMAVVHHSLGTEQWSNTLWFTKTDYVLADQQDLADRVDSTYAGNMLARYSNQMTYDGVTVYDMRSEIGAIVTDNDGAGNGGSAGDILPIQTALVLTLYTAARGKNGRGRLYLAGFSENQFSNTAFILAEETAAEAFATAMIASAAAGGWTWVVASRYNNGAPRAAAVPYAITQGVVRNRQAGTQRRRVDRP